MSPHQSHFIQNSQMILRTKSEKNPHPSWGQPRPHSPAQLHMTSLQRNDRYPRWTPAVLLYSYTAGLGFPVCLCVCVCWGARCSLCPTVSKDLMRDLTVAPGSESASPLASVGVVGIMEMPHQWRLLSESDTLTSSPWDLTDTMTGLLCRDIYNTYNLGRGDSDAHLWTED